MPIINKEKARIYRNIDDGNYYCFDIGKILSENYKNCYPFKLVEDVIVDDENRLHSYDDKHTLRYKSSGHICREWFLNGKNGRVNPEKTYLIFENFCFQVPSSEEYIYRSKIKC
jgi:hypothetical protein